MIFRPLQSSSSTSSGQSSLSSSDFCSSLSSSARLKSPLSGARGDRGELSRARCNRNEVWNPTSAPTRRHRIMLAPCRVLKNLCGVRRFDAQLDPEADEELKKIKHEHCCKARPHNYRGWTIFWINLLSLCLGIATVVIGIVALAIPAAVTIAVNIFRVRRPTSLLPVARPLALSFCCRCCRSPSSYSSRPSLACTRRAGALPLAAPRAGSSITSSTPRSRQGRLWWGWQQQLDGCNGFVTAPHRYPSSSCSFSGLSATLLFWAAGRWEAAAARVRRTCAGPPDPAYLLLCYRRT